MKNNQTPAQIWRAFLANESTELAAVAKAVKNQIGLPLADVVEELANISDCHCGMVAFWRKNRAKISALMNYEADSLGENVLGMVSCFNSLQDYTADEIGRALYGNYNGDLTQIYNSFAWFAAEEVAYRFSDYCYENDIDPFNL